MIKLNSIYNKINIFYYSILSINMISLISIVLEYNYIDISYIFIGIELIHLVVIISIINIYLLRYDNEIQLLIKAYKDSNIQLASKIKDIDILNNIVSRYNRLYILILLLGGYLLLISVLSYFYYKLLGLIPFVLYVYFALDISITLTMHKAYMIKCFETLYIARSEYEFKKSKLYERIHNEKK